MRFGKIPSRMALITTAPKIFRCGWEDVDGSLAEDKEVIPCFPADADSADNVAQGLKWGKQQNLFDRRSEAAPDQVVEDNLPRRLTVVGLEKRMEGGRSFKVVDEKARLFDLREDVLLETLLGVGVSKGGHLGGEFVFARVGSQMRLVRVGSTLHGEMLKTEKRRQSKNVKETELVVGGIYANRRELVIYLGQIDTVEDFISETDHHRMFTAQATSEHRKLKGVSAAVEKRVKVRGEHLSVPVAKYMQLEPERALQNALLNAANSSSFQFGKTISAVELVGRLEVPDNIIERLRMRALENVNSRLHNLDESSRMVDSCGVDAVRAMNRKTVISASAMLNIRTHGSGAEVSAEYEELLKRCAPE